MTQHNLQVPEELFEAAYEAAFPAKASKDELWQPVPHDVAIRRALQAILPKVRERLTKPDAIDAAYGALERDNSALIAIKAAYDAAFPPGS